LQQGQLVAAGATVSWMRGKWAGSAPRINPPFPRHIGGLRVLLDRRGLGDHLLDIFKRQIELVRIKLSQPLAFNFEALRLAQQLA
jgi:hypothetical protein